MSNLVKLPGLIDSHVHLREPGGTQKEDFESGTKAAIAGGYTAVLDMPNNAEPTISADSLNKKISLATGKTYCDVGFHFGGTPDSTKYFASLKDKVFALKVYMNHTTGQLLQEDPKILELIFSAWPDEKIIMVHAEGQTLTQAIDLAKRFNKKLHVCHVSLKKEISEIAKAKSSGMDITCEVTCHHLFLSQEDLGKLGGFGKMRPPLATKQDQEALWKAVLDKTIDTIASDHAPHTKEEKNSDNPPNGVPGLETTLPLLLTAVSEGKLTIERVIELTNTNPAKIFNIPEQANTYVEVDLDEEYSIDSSKLYTKCGWTPFDGTSVKGRIKRVVLKGAVVYDNGQVLKEPKGEVIYPK